MKVSELDDQLVSITLPGVVTVIARGILRFNPKNGLCSVLVHESSRIHAGFTFYEGEVAIKKAPAGSEYAACLVPVPE